MGYDRSGSVPLEADTVHAVPPVVTIDDVVVVERAVDLGDEAFAWSVDGGVDGDVGELVLASNPWNHACAVLVWHYRCL